MQQAVLLVTVVHPRAPAQRAPGASAAQQWRTQAAPQLPEVAAATVVRAERQWPPAAPVALLMWPSVEVAQLYRERVVRMETPLADHVS